MTYAETAQLYVDAGWPVPFPLPVGRKHPPPDGTTGQHGRDIEWTPGTEIDPWHDAEGNYGLRMPDGVIGLDVDVYGDKHGDRVIEGLEAELGPLPAGPWSSSRAWPSGIRFYRVPAGLRFRGAIPGGVEVIQRHHRYAVVWPSVVEGRAYRWHGPDGDDDRPVSLSELPELPEAWVRWLQQGASDATGPAGTPEQVAQTEAVLFAREGLCPEVAGLLADADARMAEAAEGGRHDAMTGLAFRLAHLSAAGHLSWAEGSNTLGDLWGQHVSYSGERWQEFVRIMRTALGKVEITGTTDPCALFGSAQPESSYPGPRGGEFMRPHPGFPEIEKEQGEGVSSTVEVGGVVLFDPVSAYDDSALASAVLAWHAADVRYLSDAGAWLRRHADAWEVVGVSVADGARGLVAQAARHMPRGRKDAEDGSTEKVRHERYKTLHNSAGLSRVSAYLAALVQSETGLTMRMADLDTEPEILWAGGVAWSLRASAKGPVRAEVDPGTPHARTAGCTPAQVPTPLWDAFCAAVWPDLLTQLWSLRVLSIGLTAYADRAMPILWGAPGRGKTQVMSLVSDVLGSYATAADARLLGSSDPHASVKLALAGARFATLDESPRTSHVAVEKLKNLTGGGTETGNLMGRNPVTFRYTHTLCLTSNDEPHVADDGLRSRVRSIECTGDPAEVRAARKAIGQLSGAAWQAERPGVLADLMRHAAGWLADPTTSDNPVDVELQIEAARRQQDPVLAWLDDRTTGGSGETPSPALYEDFRIYCARQGFDRPPNAIAWGRALTAAGVTGRRGAAGQRIRGLALRGQI